MSDGGETSPAAMGAAEPESVTGEGESTRDGVTSEASGDVRVYPETATVRADANPPTVTDADDVPEIGVPHDEDFSRAFDPALQIEAIRATAGHVSSSVEVLVSVTLSELRDENSRLRRELEAAHVQIEFLEHALELLREAQASGRSTWVDRTLRVVKGALLAGLTGATAGVTQGLVTAPSNVTVQIEQPAPSVSRAIELVQECDRLLALVDTLPETIPPAPEGG